MDTAKVRGTQIAATEGPAQQRKRGAATVLGKAVFKKKVGDLPTLQTEFDPLYGSPNPRAAPVRWQFNLGKARKKTF